MIEIIGAKPSRALGADIVKWIKRREKAASRGAEYRQTDEDEMELVDKVDPRSTTLLVVDMQNDYCHDDGALARNGTDVAAAQRIVPRLNELIDAARVVGVRVIFIRTTHDESTDSPVRRALPRFETMYLCRTGSWGAEYYGVAPSPRDQVVTKHRYSAFINTPLELILRSTGIRSVVVTGVATHVCVDCTARDAFQRDLFAIIASDCTATSSTELHQATLANFQRHFGDVATADEIMRAWRQKTGSKEHVADAASRSQL